jgi:hypothetical protein
MRKTLIALSAVAVVALVQAQAVPKAKTDEFTVKYDEKVAKNVSTSIFRVFQKLGKKAVKTVESGVDDVSHGLSNAYKNTWGKMIIEYGKTVGPIYRAYGDLIEEVNVNPTCNQTCAITCFKPCKVDDGMTANWTLGFKRSCFENTCGCKFNIEAKMNTTQGKKEIDGKVKKLQESLNDYNKKVSNLEKEADKIINEGIKKFEKKAEKLQRDYYDELRTTAINELGCDSACVNTCTNANYFEFYEVPTCIAECKCSKIDGALDISTGKFTLSSLAMYADGDVEAWMSFKNSI